MALTSQTASETPPGRPGTYARLTVGHTLERAAAEHGDRTAVVIGSHRLTNRQVLDEARTWAGRLAAAGVRPRDHVAILMPNCLEYLLLFYGCALLGACPVHLNSRYKREDLRYVIPDSDATVLFTSSKQKEFFDYRQMLVDVFPGLATWRKGAALSLPEAPRLRQVFHFHAPDETQWATEADFEAGPPGPFGADAVHGEDIALIMYTSGTTANPKACLLSHRALELAGRGLAKRWEMTAEDRFWDPLPFFHMSTMLPLATCRSVGATFIAQEHFDPAASNAEIENERATILFPSFPTLTTALFGHPSFDAARMKSVRVVNNVGPPDLLRRFAAQLPTACHASAYGLTEGGGVIAFNDLSDTAEQLATTSGRPFEHVEVRVVDPETGRVLPPGEPGEMQIRSDQNFSGYYKDPEKTAATVLPDGWLRTGDRCSLDADGHIRYLGRIKDMLKVGGENVAAIEIESWLCAHPAVKVAQVVGAPDDKYMEVPAAFIELKDGATLTADEVIRHCKGRIASFKIPRYVYFVTEWPMSATKIQKFRLRELIQAADRREPSQVS